jgi:hypothetical protein
MIVIQRDRLNKNMPLENDRKNDKIT